MNNFIKDVNLALQKAKQRKKQKIKEEKRSLLRNDEDWVKIDAFLQREVLRCIERSDGSSWIKIEDNSRFLGIPKDENGQEIYLSNGKTLYINHFDIKRFCKQYGFKLRFLVKKNGEFRRTFFYKKINTVAYLIKVKHIFLPFMRRSK